MLGIFLIYRCKKIEVDCESLHYKCVQHSRKAIQVLFLALEEFAVSMTTSLVLFVPRFIITDHRSRV